MATMETISRERTLLYEQVAERISAMVSHGTFLSGDRLPSVRNLSQQFRVSKSTVMEAYALLEDRGMVAVRPQSGYYVCRPAHTMLRESGDLHVPPPTVVTTGELALMVFRDAADSRLIQLGAAIPDPENLPVDRLNRMLSAEARRHGRQSLAYERPAGCLRLRTQIARKMVTAGCSLSPDDILVTNGCSEAVMLALRAVCNPGDTVAVESPTFFNTLQAIASLGLKALEIPAHPVHGVNVDTLRYVLEQNRVNACLFVTNFSNPLGYLMPDPAKAELVALLARHGIPLIEDDIYGELSFDNRRPQVAKSYDSDGLVLLCSSFSKTVAPGYRVGWIVPGKFASKVERLKVVTSLTTAVPPQLAIAEYLHNGGYESHLRRLRRMYARQSVALSQAVTRHFPEGTRTSRPEGGFVLWVEMPECVDSVKLYEQARECGITFAPGPIFSAQPGKFGNYIRLSAAFWSDKVAKGVERLGRLVMEMHRAAAAR